MSKIEKMRNKKQQEVISHKADLAEGGQQSRLPGVYSGIVALFLSLFLAQGVQ